MIDPWSVLGVPRGADIETIKRAWRQRVRETHPDLHPGDPHAAERFRRVQAAWEALALGPSRSALDDILGAASMRAPHPVEPPPIHDERPRLDPANPHGDPTRPRREAGAARRPDRGDDVFVSLTVPFVDAATGRPQTLRVSRLLACGACGGSGFGRGSARSCADCRGTGRSTDRFGRPTTCRTCDGKRELPGPLCPTCKGEGLTRQTARVEIPVPAGVADGDHLQVLGQGDAGRRGAPPGDLVVTVQVETQRFFRQDGARVLADVRLTLGEALLGADLELPSPVGLLRLRVPPGTRSGDRLAFEPARPGEPSRSTLDAVVEVVLPPVDPEDPSVRAALATLEARYPANPRDEDGAPGRGSE